MSLGILMKAANSIYFRKFIDFFFEFIPQIVLMLALFGYMDMLIIIKWLTDYDNGESNPPSIITSMINMFLNFGGIDGTPLYGTESIMKAVQIMLLFIAFICVPLMLFIKPMAFRRKH
jgi:V-type H+-transporting ATPase subunit a